MRPAKAHRRAEPVPRADAAELAQTCRDKFEQRAAEARRWVAREFAVDAVCVVATSQVEFDSLVAQVEALLLAGE